MTQSAFSHPILYSFRRCPYAMRARLGLCYAEQTVELREVILRDKPAELSQISPKATVPVLQLDSVIVVDESVDIARWALAQHDPQHLLGASSAQQTEMNALIADNDGEFKHWLDRYKYADRYPEHTEHYYREQGELFLRRLEQRLSQQMYLFGEAVSLADIAIMPFVRQFAHVKKSWFDAANYPALQRWLAAWLQSDAFLQIMPKYPQWQAGELPLVISYSRPVSPLLLD